MIQQKPLLAAFLAVIVTLAACDSNEIGDSKDVNQDKIYMDYEISYNEPDADVELNFQYRFAGSAGTTLVLNDGSLVELDGEKLKVDSSEGGGAFYETRKKFSNFNGTHSIAFTDINGKKFENNFDFTTFALHALPAAVDHNKDLMIAYSTLALGPNDYVEINSIGSDSSFRIRQAGPDSSLIITAKELQRQKEKTVTIGCSLYREVALTQVTSEGGSLKIYYRLKPIKIRLQP